MVKEDGMRFPRVRTPKKDYIRFFHLGVRTRAAACSKDRRQTDDARGVSSAVATVDVVAPDHRANELLRNVVQLVGGFGATEHAKHPGVVLPDRGAEALGNLAQSFIPGGWTMTPVLANQRLGEAAARWNRHTSLG